MYTSVSAIEIPLDGNDREINLDGRDILQFEVKNKGTASLTLFTNTLLEEDDCWASPINPIGLTYSGKVKLKWSVDGTKTALVYALVGQKNG